MQETEIGNQEASCHCKWKRRVLPIHPMAKILIVLGLIFLTLGLTFHFFPGLLKWPGKLPGDFSYQGSNFSFHFPMATSILVSLILSLIFWLLKK